MSNSVLPLPTYPAGSRGWPIKKSPQFNTLIETPVSRRGETRISTTPYCTWNFELTFPLLKGTFNDATSYLNQLVGFYMQMQGQANSFLFDDPHDNLIPSNAPAVFGLGDSSTKVFQITRPIGNYADIIQNLKPSPVIYQNGAAARNLVPDSDGTGLTWAGDPLLVFSSTGGAIAGGKWTYTGTGAASGFRIVTNPTISVVPGATYTLSGYIDATHVTSFASGTPSWLVYDPTITTQYAAAAVGTPVNGRVTGTFTVPTGVTQVKVFPDTGNCTVATGQPLTFSNPQLESGSVATSYQSSFAYSIDTLGVLRFTTPPANGAVLAWSGGYYFRCRFSDDSLGDLAQIFTNVWQIAQVKFQSIIL